MPSSKNRIRRDEIGFADTQRNDIFHRGGDVEEFADAGWQRGGDLSGNVAVHSRAFLNLRVKCTQRRADAK